MAGYELTVEEFRQLLTYSTYRTETAPLLADWYGYVVSDDGDVTDQDGSPVDIPRLHAAIQATRKSS